MTPEIIQLVEVFDDNGDPISKLCVKTYLTEEELYMPADKFAALAAGNKLARVRREISETIGGPGYSSVRVSTSIELAVDQHETTIKTAADAIMAECVILNEEAVLKAYEGLLAHRKTLGLT